MGNTFTAFAEQPEVVVQVEEVLSVSAPVEFPVETIETEAPAPVLEKEPEPAPEMPQATEQDVEQVKQELVDDLVAKIAGEDDANLDLLLKPEIVTAPYDPRFPNMNQSRHCFIRYNEYYKCLVERGDDNPRCQFYKRAYESMCPADWLEEWQTLRDQGLWTGKY